MNLAVLAPDWAVWTLIGLLVLASLQDAAKLKISNLICGAVMLLGIATALFVGPQWSLWQNLLVFTIALTIGTWMFSAGILGGGDVKLFAATVLWFDLSGALRLLLAVAIAGGLLSIVIIALRTIGWSDGIRQRVIVLRAKAGIPYGIAIAVGAVAAVMLLQQSSRPLDPRANWSALPGAR